MEQNSILLNKNVKLEEVRIGNLVQNDRIGVFKIDTGSLLNISERPKRNKDKYQPVPLTEEWLEYLGFEQEKGMMVWRNEVDESVEIVYETLAEYFRLYPRTNLIRYVHQLQNIFYALTGTELTTK